MKLNQEEIKILAILLKSSKSIQGYTAYIRSGMEKNKFFRTVRKLENEGLIHKEGISLAITEKGIDLASKTIRRKTEKPWREMLQKHKGKKIEKNEMYIPKRSLLSKGFKGSLKDDIML